MSAPARGAAAVDAARAGFRVFPVTPRGKKPLRKGWQRGATTDLAVVEATWAELPDANIGVACGRGLVVVDTDSDAGEAAMRELGLPPTPTVRTANGRHRYFNGSGRNRTSVLPGLDVRGDGGFVVGAGSQHPSGVEYEWEIPPLEVVRAPAPPALVALLSKRAARVATLDGRIEQGARNATLFRLACSIRGRYGASFDELLALLVAANARRCAPPLDDAEVVRIAQSAASYDEPPRWATDPIAFAHDPALGARERLLLIALARYADDEGRCWPSIRRLRADTRMATDTVERASENLVAAERIVVQRRRGTSNLYTLSGFPQRLLGSSRQQEGGSSVLDVGTHRGDAR